MSARLNILGGKRAGESIELEDGSYQLGTGRAADIQLRDKGVGFKHAQLIVRGDQVSVIDFKSRGGTFVNGAQIDPNTEVPVGGGDSLQVGTTELTVEAGSGAAPESQEAPTKAAEAVQEETLAPEADEAEEFLDEAPDLDPPPVEEPQFLSAEEAAALDPEPFLADPEPVAAEPKPAPARGPDPVVATALASSDVNLLKQTLEDLQRKLSAKTQEADALTKALEATASAPAVDGLGGAVSGYGASVEEEYKDQIIGLQQSLSEESAKVFQLEDEVKALTARVSDTESRHAGEFDRVEKEKNSIEDSLEKAYTEIARLKKSLEKSTGLEELEEANALLLDENEGLKEEISALKFSIEEEQSKRGALVRDRVTGLRSETARMEESNAEMRTLVEAYEEKIDELDERMEELEGENEALESLVADLRGELAKTKKERETMVKTLRKKLGALELRLESRTARSDSEQKQAV